MSIELKVGEWYETKAGVRVKVIADAREHSPVPSNPAEGINCIAAIMLSGRVRAYYPQGNVYTDYYDGEGDVRSNPNMNDIVKHLEGCTGWDWVEPKPQVWRDATPQDALRDPPLRCRVKDYESKEWSECELVLVGYTNRSYTEYPWTTDYKGTESSWPLCQVLDE